MSAIKIRSLSGDRELDICARMMSESEPWLTLHRNYRGSKQTISDSTKEVYLATMEKTIAGFIVINMTGTFIGYIQSVCVAGELRRRGIGTKLMLDAEKRIFRDTPNIFLCVSSFNEGARKLYERLGYSEVGKLPNYLISGASEILLRKTIAPLTEFAPRVE